MKEHITPLQLFFLTFSYLYSGFLLSRSLWQAGNGAPLAALLGTGAGLVWYFFLGNCGETGFSCGKMGKICLFLLFSALLWGNLCDYGRFCQSELIPSFPPCLFSLAFGVLCLYAATLGLRTLGRFSEVCAFALVPLLLLLFFGLFTAERQGTLSLPPPSVSLLRGAAGLFFSTFGDGVLLLSLSDRLVARASSGATAEARADTAAMRRAFPVLSRLSPRRKPFRTALVSGALCAAVLICASVLRDAWLIGAETLAPVRFPFAYAAHKTQSEVLLPFFTLCLLLVLSVRSVLLFGECARFARAILPGCEVLLPALVLFSLLAVSSVFPGLTEAVLSSPAFAVFYGLTALFLPIRKEISALLQKRFDKSEKV